MEGCGEVCVSLSWGVHLPPNKHVSCVSRGKNILRVVSSTKFSRRDTVQNTDFHMLDFVAHFKTSNSN